MRLGGDMGTKGRNAAPRRIPSVPVLLGVIAAAAPPLLPASAQVYGVALPDLWNKTLAVRPKKIPAGGTVEIISAVRNLGAADLAPAPDREEGQPAIAVRFVLVANVRHREGTEAGAWGFDALERREVVRHTATWTVPADLAPGMWFLCADVDPENAVRESNEMNNRTCHPLTVEPPLDLAAEAPEGDEELPDEGGETPPETAEPGESGPSEPGGES